MARSQRAGVAVAILSVHAIILYGLANLGPVLTRTPTGQPLIVHFISAPDSPRRWQPPAVSHLPQEIRAQLPELPSMELPVPVAESERAISAAAQNQPEERVARDERSVPRLISTVEYLREPSPRYPPQSRRLREQGLVVLRVLIDEQGNACDIDIETSSGYARLDYAAREAVQRAAFRPYIKDGAPRRALVLIPIEFSLNRGIA